MENRVIDAIAKRLLLRSLKAISDCHIEIICREATYHFGDPSHALIATLAVHSDAFFTRALSGGDIGVGESFMDGDWSSPDLVSVVRAATRNMARIEGGNRAVSGLRRLVEWMRHRRNDNTLTGSSRNIAHHYDLGNDFYGLFLDETLAYSCGLFQTKEDSLREAQIRKFEHICRKLQLSPRDHLLEIGTGWGGFAAYAAQAYGCRITTTTISRKQLDYAEKLFQPLLAEGHRIELLFQDYRELSGKFDKIVSIEMFEAVGYRHYDEFFGTCDRLLKSDGIMLMQSITMNEKHFAAYLRQSDFIKKYIFPGAELASVARIIASLAHATKLQLAHLEDIGQHYSETLRAWRMRLLDRAQDVADLGFDGRFLRMWEFYLAYCEGAFRERYIGDVQVLLAKAGAETLFHDPGGREFTWPAPKIHSAATPAHRVNPSEITRIPWPREGQGHTSNA